MPLTSKGSEIMAALTKEYGEKKGEQVFYALKNKGTIKGVDHALTIPEFNKTKDGRYAKDMNPEEFDKLRGLLSKWIGEEEAEPEHATGDADRPRFEAEKVKGEWRVLKNGQVYGPPCESEVACIRVIERLSKQ